MLIPLRPDVAAQSYTDPNFLISSRTELSSAAAHDCRTRGLYCASENMASKFYL